MSQSKRPRKKKLKKEAPPAVEEPPAAGKHFIRQIIEEDLKAGKNEGRLQTRFPPEPNGCLHIGHAKAICLDFGMAREYGGLCNLRFDDTNPAKEESEYVESIKKDVRWLGFDWGEREFYTSDYFGQLYEYARKLIEKGLAYVCDMSAAEVAESRGSPARPGKESPWRNRSIEENLDLFRRMKAGEFPDGAKTLRAKIDMASPNMHLRDPAIYRIRHAPHHRTGGKWPIYPMYDYAHCVSDSIEKITHSLCTLEFEVHRPLYDWFLEKLEIFRSRQIEFARLNLTYTIMSKRRLIEIVREGFVKGWDDPRMPTLCGLRRRGYTPEAIRNFCERVGIAKRENVIELELFEHCLRADLEKRADRRMAVLNPLRLVVSNYPGGQTEKFNIPNHPDDGSRGTRPVPFSKVLYIERDDFREDPPKKFFRLAPGREVRLRHAYIIKCEEVVKDEHTGEIKELRCTCDPDSRSGSPGAQRKVKGVIHWVSAEHAVTGEARLYDRLFLKTDPDDTREGQDWRANLNPDSLRVQPCLVEPSLGSARAGTRCQFERLGYFCADSNSVPGRPVFNRAVPLRDSWSKQEHKK